MFKFIKISLKREQPIASPSPNRPIKIEKIEENERNTSDDIFNLSNISKELDDSDLLRELLGLLFIYIFLIFFL